MTGETKYVGWEAEGNDYVCGASEAQVQINNALTWAAGASGINTVYLRGPYTYVLGVNDGNLLIGGHTVLTGDATAVIKVPDTAMWTHFLPIIGQRGGAGASTSDIEISNITIDGNESHTYHAGTGDPERIYGKGYYNSIFIRGPSRTAPISNINIHHVTIRDSLGDGTRLEFVNNVRVHHNIMNNLMHASIYCTECDDIDIYENTIKYITNAGVRFDHCSNAKIRDNNISIWGDDAGETTSAWVGGDNAIQIGNQPSSYNRTKLNQNIEIYNNTINKSAGGGICFMDMMRNAGTTAQNVHVYNNRISGCGTSDSTTTRRGGITIYAWGNGLLIENNTIENNYKSGIKVDISIASGCSATIQNNNITGTLQPDKGGYGIWNVVPSDFSVIAKNNYLQNNSGGNYYNVTPVSEASSAITTAYPGGTSSDDVVTDPNDDDEVIVEPPDTDPATILYQQGVDKSYYVTGRTAYINQTPFYWVGKKVDVGNSLGQDKCPGAVGWALTDFDLEGAEITFDCFAPNFLELHKAIASLTKPGRTVIELGGDYANWQISGVKADYSTDLRLSSDIPRNCHPYSFLLCMDSPYLESIVQRHRSRYIYSSMQFSADDCFSGNMIANSSFEDWTPSNSLAWSRVATLADLDWRVVRYSKENRTFCAISATGPGYVMLSDGNTWRLPTGSNTWANKNSWRGLAWCDSWNLWVMCSSSGTAAKVLTSADNGNRWDIKITPVNDCGWINALWIPPDDTLTTGRVLFFASSGSNNSTQARCMYSDDGCDTFTEVLTDYNSNGWMNSAYSPELNRIVVVAYAGSTTSRVMTSDDYGATWTHRTCPNRAWTGVCWADLLGLFVAVSEGGTDVSTQTQYIMTSPDGITWTLRDTPIMSTTSTPTGGDVQTFIYNTEDGYTYTTLETSYYDSAAPIYTLAAPTTSGNFYRLDNASVQLRSQYAGVTASFKLTFQSGTGAEETVVEWTNNTTNYVTKSITVAKEAVANESLTLRAYMKTSNGSYKAIATKIAYTIKESGTTGSAVTYTYNQWRAVTWARELGLLVAVAQTGTDNASMYSSDGITWFVSSTPIDSGYTSVCYAGDKNQFMAVGRLGTGYRSMTSLNYGSVSDIAPNGWTLGTTGQSRSESTAQDGIYSVAITGDGTETRGEIKQRVYFESGKRYLLSAYGKVDGLTAGSLRVDILVGSSVVKELIWDTGTDWTQKQISIKFDVKPSEAYLRVRGYNLNTGATVYCDKALIQDATYYELSTTGVDIATYGTVDTIPDVIVQGVDVSSAPVTTGVVKTYTTESDTVYTTLLTSYDNKAAPAMVLPALANGSIYRLDQIYAKLRTAHAGTNAYLKVTVQFGSGTETTLVEWYTNSATFAQGKRDLNLKSLTNQTVTFRWYMKTASTSYKAITTELGYRVTVLTETAAASTRNLHVWNTSDTSKIMDVCDILLPKYTIEINADGTGSLTYAEDFMDSNYTVTAYAKSGETYNSTNKTLVLAASGYITFQMPGKYPVTGVPILKAFVKSGAPQIYIADDSGSNGAPGTFYAIDNNITDSITDAEITRLLDNVTSLRLNSKTNYYVKITPYSTNTCEFGGLSIKSSLATIDAERFKINATRAANTIAVQVDDTASAILTLRYRDLDPVV